MIRLYALCQNINPVTLWGLGKPLDVLTGIKNGLDMFDCVLPTRNARNGQFLTSRGPLNIKRRGLKKTLCRLTQSVLAKFAPVIREVMCVICSMSANILRGN